MSKPDVFCKYCQSPNVIKYGKLKDVQRYYCKDCKRKFANTSPFEEWWPSFLRQYPSLAKEAQEASLTESIKVIAYAAWVASTEHHLCLQSFTENDRIAERMKDYWKCQNSGEE